MILTFNKAAVKELLDHAFTAPEHAPTFEEMCDPECRKDGNAPDFDAGAVLPEDVDPALITPGLHLVGDDGVYLVSNGRPALMASERMQRVAYAKECDPETMDPDTVWGAKNESFGGDDGVEKIDAYDIQHWIDRTAGEVLRMKIGPDQFELLISDQP